MSSQLRRVCLVTLASLSVTACSGASGGSPVQSVAAPSSATVASPSTDPLIGDAVADALATINEIDRLFQRGPSDGTIGLLADTAAKGRASLAREPARLTTMEVFQVYDLSLQALLADTTLNDHSAIAKDCQWLLYTVREQIATVPR